MCSWQVAVPRSGPWARPLIIMAHEPQIALAAIVVERDRLRTVGDEPLVEHVEQLEERHVGTHVVDVVVLEPAPVVRAVLTPDAEMNLHL